MVEGVVVVVVCCFGGFRLNVCMYVCITLRLYVFMYVCMYISCLHYVMLSTWKDVCIQSVDGFIFLQRIPLRRLLEPEQLPGLRILHWGNMRQSCMYVCMYVCMYGHTWFQALEANRFVFFTNGLLHEMNENIWKLMPVLR